MHKKILIVEDDPVTKEFYKFVFKKAGYQFNIVEGVSELLYELNNSSVSLIIMDINLKNTYVNKLQTDGTRLSRYIKQSEKFSSIPILIVTGYTISKNADNFFRESLADDFFVKPITDIELFLGKVNQMIEN